MHGLEWVFTIVLVAIFLVTGVNKAFRYEKAKDLFPWVKHTPRALVQGIGIAEILGALGLLLPVATGFFPWLTPVAAAALALLMLFATVFHFRRGEKSEASLNILLLAILAFIIYIRWPLIS